MTYDQIKYLSRFKLHDFCLVFRHKIVSPRAVWADKNIMYVYIAVILYRHFTTLLVGYDSPIFSLII